MPFFPLNWKQEDGRNKIPSMGAPEFVSFCSHTCCPSHPQTHTLKCSAHLFLLQRLKLLHFKKQTASRHQFIIRTGFLNPALFHDDNPVGLADR